MFLISSSRRSAASSILPETAANVYNFVECWCRDSGTQVLRIAPNGHGFFYSGVREYAYSLLGPVGTPFDLIEPESGASLRPVIVGIDITLTLPTDVVSDEPVPDEHVLHQLLV